MSTQTPAADAALPARRARGRDWAPRWAVAVAVVGMALALVPLWYGIALLVDAGSGPTDDADAIGTALGQVALFAAVAVLAILGWFLARRS
ncbi:hypothetical protein MWU75_19440 [Ornithinimicrobium sp. F0845]|uniref:hypothetical protein n=1 Tax=Ornithinimicrobium sp. F0845 TaxID=2926412 RepID=UPI001FF5E921|nr:hypothetical protein [Ornithinimicrobium sp. F0845]MCK0114317.1 hypothetical protein [Ornithinimicrobium sp. F0845]